MRRVVFSTGFRSGLIAFGLSVAVLLPALAEAAQPEGFLLTCRPGKGMSGKIADDGSLRLRYLRAEEGSQEGSSPRPGECAWFDRGFRKGEPDALFVAGDLPGFNELVASVKHGGIFQVHAFNNNQGAMVVTNIDETGVSEEKPADQAHAGFAGAWDTKTSAGGQFLFLFEEKADGTLTGEFRHTDARFDGKLADVSVNDAGTEIAFTFTQPGIGVAGTGSLHLTGEGNAFDGTFSVDSDPGKVFGWKGKRRD